MKTVVIKEIDSVKTPDVYTLDLHGRSIKDCTGCWTCWWKTPGRCVFDDLDEFYRNYIQAERAVFLARTVRGFVSGNLKTLFDRMIPLYLPYTEYSTGESMHVPRYERYPDVDFFYESDFADPGGRKIFEEYINRVFYQFHSKNISVKPLEEFTGEGVTQK